MSNNKAKGRRYTPKEKAQVLTFVDKTNAQRGRGGITAAARKFGITPLTISNWVRERGAGHTPVPRPDGDFAVNLRRLADLHEAISKKESELADLHREYAALKKKL